MLAAVWIYGHAALGALLWFCACGFYFAIWRRVRISSAVGLGYALQAALLGIAAGFLFFMETPLETLIEKRPLYHVRLVLFDVAAIISLLCARWTMETSKRLDVEDLRRIVQRAASEARAKAGAAS